MTLILIYVFNVSLDTYINMVKKLYKEFHQMYLYSLVLSASRSRKDLFRSIKDQIILEVFESNHPKASEKQYCRLSGRFTKEQSGKTTKTICQTKEKCLTKILALNPEPMNPFDQIRIQELWPEESLDKDLCLV